MKTRLPHRLWGLVGCALVLAGPCFAEVRIDPGASPDMETAAIAQTLRSAVAARPIAGDAADVRITVGLPALRDALASTDKRPLLATFITSTDFYAALGDRRRPLNVTAVFSNPDPSDQLALAEILLGRSSLGVFASPSVHHLLTHLDPRAVQSIPADPKQSIDSLLQATAGVTGIIALPDSNVINRTNIGYLVRVLYQRHAALIGYSQTLTRAGALASVYVTQDAMTAEIIAVATQLASGVSASEPVFVRDVSIAVNEQLARSLNIAAPPMADLMLTIKRRRKEGDR